MRHVVVWFTLLAAPGVVASAEMEWIEISADGRSFVQSPSGKSFVPWGVNYDRDRRGRLLEDYWDEEWADVVEDFREIRDLGMNVVRIHLQFGKFMNSPVEAKESSLDRLEKLVQLAEETGLYLDLTGLGCYHKKDVPSWYDALKEQERWDAQAQFWKAVARRCAGQPAVFCYDLMNEPTAGGDAQQTDWLAGDFFGKHYVQRIALDRADRSPQQIASVWIRQLAGAVREVDARHLVTVGMLDELESGFVPGEVAGELDFVSVHVYPRSQALAEDLENLRRFQIGKPLIIEEIFPLRCSVDETLEFIEASRPYVQGWISFYWGETAAELRASGRPNFEKQLDWIQRFQAQGREMTGAP